jgi:GNAT superfamily N-acetyltransferase
MLIRAKRWMDEWFSRDLNETHFHLGPVAVDKHMQGQGMGSAMLSAVCTWMDILGATAYLETDKPINVRFYERFGFATVREDQVLGIPNWFLRRPAGKFPSEAMHRASTGLDKTAVENLGWELLM